MPAIAPTARLLREPSLAFLAIAFMVLSGCSSAAGREPTAGRLLRIVAAENFWGSIAGQVGGSGVTVRNIIHAPATDPHDYEPTPADARAIASADLVIVNGLGYDGWAQRLLSASPGPAVIDVGKLLGLGSNANPHRWYDPADVDRVIAAVAAALARIEPTKAAQFQGSAADFESQGLATYHALIGAIRNRYAGTAVGASESVFAMLAPALGLDLVTPPSFLRAVTEGSDVSSADVTTVTRQIKSKRIRIYVYNSQNTTPDIQAQLRACRAAGIPTASITETLSPAGASFQDWQATQLRGIADALANGTGR